MATMLGGSSSLLLVYFVAEVQRHLQARHMYYSVSSGSSGPGWTDTFLEPIPCGRKTFLISTKVRFRLRVNVALVSACDRVGVGTILKLKPWDKCATPLLRPPIQEHGETIARGASVCERQTEEKTDKQASDCGLPNFIDL